MAKLTGVEPNFITVSEVKAIFYYIFYLLKFKAAGPSFFSSGILSNKMPIIPCIASSGAFCIDVLPSILITLELETLLEEDPLGNADVIPVFKASVIASVKPAAAKFGTAP